MKEVSDKGTNKYINVILSKRKGLKISIIFANWSLPVWNVDIYIYICVHKHDHTNHTSYFNNIYSHFFTVVMVKPLTLIHY